MGWKIDRRLFEVQFITWMPGALRLQDPKRPPLDANTKVAAGCKLWVPWPVDERSGEYAPENMNQDEHGIEWAFAEVKKVKPEGMEVLAILGYKDLQLMESTIVNQPEAGSGTGLGSKAQSQ